ncbi:MAG: DUF1573 domain-containing protein [Porphyromonadaceae bacterium]|nr:MAG: DUF1573 domain-containing protein [Porphyromonadaceae bacterium]
MKKTALFILAAGALVFTTLPVNAQKKVTLQEVQKETQKSQETQAVTNPAEPAKRINPVTGVPATPPAAANVATPGNPAAANQVASPAPPVPLTCTWDVTDYDFGKNVMQLKPASATFTITNAGKDPVTITMVQPSCGCTSPKYTKEPIKPGEKGEVVLTFNAAMSGFFSKSAQVKLNDGQKYTLTIKGEVQKVEQTTPTNPLGIPTTPPVIK